MTRARSAAAVTRSLLSLSLLAACTGAGPGAGPTWSDPFAYCAAVRVVDAPDVRYTGAPMPDAIAAGLRRAIGAPADAPLELFSRGASRRCMDGKVYACTVGANLPCQERADTRRDPGQAMAEFCRQDPAADVVPAYVTGRRTVYQWRCAGGTPEIVRQVATPDTRGFLSNIWYEIPADSR
jgi:hypothetical protein